MIIRHETEIKATFIKYCKVILGKNFTRLPLLMKPAAKCIKEVGDL